MDNIKVLKNTEHNGVEVYFNDRPNANIITELKNHFFKWHTAKKCWYARATEQAQKFIETLTNTKIDITASEKTCKQEPKGQQNTLQLKTIRIATEEERKQIAKEQWQDEKMQQYLLNTYEYYFTQDGYILEFEKASKRAITKELYYDDEYDAPQVNLFNFMQENKHNGLVNAIEQAKKNLTIENVYFCLTSNHIKCEKQCFIYILDGWELEDKKHFYKIFRNLTQDEKIDYLAIMEHIQAQYNERLEKYFKKYGNKITTHGYWANR